MHRKNADTSREVATLRREGYVAQDRKTGVTITDSGRWALRDGLLTRSGRRSGPSAGNDDGNGSVHHA